MVLERSPHIENLIASDMVKCKQSAAIKREKAIESLRLESLKPVRITDQVSARQSGMKKPGSYKKAKTSLNVCVVSNPNGTKGNYKPRLKSSRRLRKVRVPKLKFNLMIPPPLPEPPPNRSKKAAGQSCARLPLGAGVVVEERNLALESCKSQITSTSKEQVEHNHDLSKIQLREMPWEPPKDRQDEWVNDHNDHNISRQS